MNQFKVPPGKALGCLPRATKVGQIAPKLEDSVQIIPKEKWKDYITPDLRLDKHVHTVFDQDGVKSCAAESSTQALQIIRSWQNQPFVKLNPWTLYYFSGNGKDHGSCIDLNILHLKNVGVLPEKVHPRERGWDSEPSNDDLHNVASHFRIDEFYDLQTIDEVGTALLLRFPVVFGWLGHSCVMTDLLLSDGSNHIASYVNSWGKNWNRNGRCILGLDQIYFGYGVLAIRTAIDTSQDIYTNYNLL